MPWHTGQSPFNVGKCWPSFAYRISFALFTDFWWATLLELKAPSLIDSVSWLPAGESNSSSNKDETESCGLNIVGSKVCADDEIPRKLGKAVTLGVAGSMLVSGTQKRLSAVLNAPESPWPVELTLRVLSGDSGRWPG